MTSFSLMVAMLIMIGSFRNSLEGWLTHVLPADLYLRATHNGETGYFTSEEQARIAATPGVKEIKFLRIQNLLLRPDLPPIILLAREIDAAAAHDLLPLIGPSHVPRADEPPPVWISEIAADLLQYRIGERITLPIGGQAVDFIVSGIWRDYARQTGAIVIDRALYIHITGDLLANDAALRLTSGMSIEQVKQALRERLGGD